MLARADAQVVDKQFQAVIIFTRTTCKHSDRVPEQTSFASKYANEEEKSRDFEMKTHTGRTASPHPELPAAGWYVFHVCTDDFFPHGFRGDAGHTLSLCHASFHSLWAT